MVGHLLLDILSIRERICAQQSAASRVCDLSSLSTTVSTLIYVNDQACSRSNYSMPTHLTHSLALARAGGYALGVKLVRGAYHPHEVAAHQLARPAGSPTGSYLSKHSRSLSISPEPEPPVQPSKSATDQCYYDCVTLLIDAISRDVHRSGPFGAPGIGVFFGTHSWTSCEFILEELVKKGLGVVERGGIDEVQESAVRIPLEVGERIAFGQLYGTFIFLCFLSNVAWTHCPICRDVRCTDELPRRAGAV
jgi:proline dehydrogenase